MLESDTQTPATVSRGEAIFLPTTFGDFEAFSITDPHTGEDHVVLTVGDVSGADVLMRMHSECLTGDIFGSLRCDCGPQLHDALEAIQQEGRGVLIYLRGHEGRGIGIAAKLRTYALQQQGIDTVDANLQLGFDADARAYSVAKVLCQDLGIESVRLLTHNPEKAQALEELGIKVTGIVEQVAHVNKHNQRYLQTKRDRMGHTLSLD